MKTIVKRTCPKNGLTSNTVTYSDILLVFDEKRNVIGTIALVYWEGMTRYAIVTKVGGGYHTSLHLCIEEAFKLGYLVFKQSTNKVLGTLEQVYPSLSKDCIYVDEVVENSIVLVHNIHGDLLGVITKINSRWKVMKGVKAAPVPDCSTMKSLLDCCLAASYKLTLID